MHKKKERILFLKKKPSLQQVFYLKMICSQFIDMAWGSCLRFTKKGEFMEKLSFPVIQHGSSLSCKLKILLEREAKIFSTFTMHLLLLTP